MPPKKLSKKFIINKLDLKLHLDLLHNLNPHYEVAVQLAINPEGVNF